jgi:predicted Zn-dependent peptidase
MSLPATPDIAFERHTLDNGLRVVLHRESSLPLAAVNLWYHVGSKNERPGRTGFAHIFEHMLFQGSEHVATHDHFRYVQQVGGVANGSTWFDRTNYYETVPAHQLDLALWLESDRMGFFLPALTQQNLDTQREVVLNERRQRVENQPYGLAGERLHELLYPEGHPYHWPVIGYSGDIAAATLEDVRAFFRTYYTPNNSVLTLAGDFAPREALARIEAWFGEIPPGPPVPPVAAPLPPLGGERRAVLPDNVLLPRVYIAYRAPAFGERLWYAADLLGGVLAGGKSSPLYRELVYERQIAQDVGTSVGPYECAGTFILVATARPGVELGLLEESLLRAVARATAEPPDPADLERARNRMLTDIYSSLQKLESLADLYSQYTTYFDDPGAVAAEAGRYLEITAQDIMDYAAGWCPEAERVVLSVVPHG